MISILSELTVDELNDINEFGIETHSRDILLDLMADKFTSWDHWLMNCEDGEEFHALWKEVVTARN